MRTPEIVNLILLVLGGVVTIVSIFTMFLRIKQAKNIKVTRKDTGQSVTVSRKLNREDLHDIAELVK